MTNFGKKHWAAAALIALMAVGCSSTDSGTEEDGGAGGSAGTGGAGGSAGDDGGTAGTGGSAGDDGGTEAATEAGDEGDADVDPCQACVLATCGTEAQACLADTDCSAALQTLQTCIANPGDAGVQGCGEDFALNGCTNPDPDAGCAANDLLTCINTGGDAGTGCTVECGL